jgi:hypothetical protein
MWKLFLRAGHGRIIGMFTSEELAEEAMLMEMMAQLSEDRACREIEEDAAAEREYREVREISDEELLDGLRDWYSVEYEA